MSLATWTAEFYPVPADQVPAEEAVAHSLRKWRGLTKENLERHGGEINLCDAKFGTERIAIDVSTCALCIHYYNDGSCWKCPLKRLLGKKCFRRGEPYHKWGCTGDPLPMIRALEACEVKDG